MKSKIALIATAAIQVVGFVLIVGALAAINEYLAVGFVGATLIGCGLLLSRWLDRR